ncbi:MAG: hypothetical protein LC104_00950 [Bacteroidales bacterium]|nr:hypothetical protein [Bacteroidales bacterium]
MLTQINDKLTITPTGLRFNADLTFEEWSSMAPKIGGALKSMAFVIGDWMIYGEEKFAVQPCIPGLEDNDPRHIRVSAPNYLATQAATSLDPTTLKNYAYVSRRVPMSLRNDFLSWEHHKVVAKLATDKQVEWLNIAAAGDCGERISVRRLRASITSGRVLSPEELSVPPSEQGVTNHIPSINRLCGWWKQIGGTDWIKTRSREQVAALLRDFEPVLSIINQLNTSIK